MDSLANCIETKNPSETIELEGKERMEYINIDGLIKLENVTQFMRKI